MNKKIIFLIILGIVIFALRLANINEFIYDDEANFAYSLTVMDAWGFNHDYYSPQPLNLLYKPLVAVFGLETWVFRIVPWMLGILNTLLVYLFARRNWNDRVAFWATFLMLVSFYPTLASLQFDVEGNLVMFSVLLMFFSYLEYERLKIKEGSSKKRMLGWQILSGIGLGIAVICKYNIIYIVIVLAVYSLLQRHWNFRQSFRDVFPIYLVGFLLFLAYILLAMLASPADWMAFALGIGRGVGFSRYNPSGISFLGITLYLLWGTLLLVGFYIIGAWQRRKEMTLPLVWISVALLFYTVVLTYGSIERYLMNTIPALAILGGMVLSSLRPSKKQLLAGACCLLGSLALFFLLNSLPVKNVARFPSAYFQEISNLNFQFLFSYTSASGPTFGVSFLPLFIAFAGGFLLLIFYLLFRKSIIGNWLFIVFFVLSLAFNLFLVGEYLFHPTSADVSSVKWEMVNMAREKNLPLPFYVNDMGMQWYFEQDFWGKRYTKTEGFGDNEVGLKSYNAIDRIRKEGGTLFLLHWPPLPKESPAWEVVALCQKEKQFFSKGVVVGEIYQC